MRWAKAVFALFVALLSVVLAAISFVFATETGTRLALASLAPAAGIAIDGIDGRLGDTLRIGRIDVSDPQGVWLEIRQVRLDWTPSALFAGRIRIALLAADEANILRAPISPETSNSEPFSIPRLPEIAVGNLEIGRIAIAPALTGGVAADVSLKGSLKPSQNAKELKLTAVSTGETPAELRIDSRIGETIAGSMRFAETAGGPVGQMTGMAPEHGLVFDLNGNLSQAHAEATVIVENGEVLLQANLLGRPVADGMHYEAEWTGKLPPRFVSGRRVLGAPLTGRLTGDRDTVSGDIRAGTLHAEWGEMRLDGQGSNRLDQVEGNLTLTAASLAPFSDLAGTPLGGAARLEAAIGGRTGDLAIGYRLSGGELTVAEQHLREAAFEGKVQLDGERWTKAGWGRADASGTLLATQNDGQEWRGDFHAATEKAQVFDTFDLHLAGPPALVSFKGRYDLADGLPEGRLRAEANLGRIDPALRGQVEATAELAKEDNGIAVSVTARTGRLEGLPPVAANLSSIGTVLDAEVLFVPGREVVIESATFKGNGPDGGRSELTAEGRYELQGGFVAAKGDGELHLAGMPEVTVAFDGSGEDGNWIVEQMWAEAGKARVEGKGRINAAGLVDGTVGIRIPDLAPFSKLANTKLSGSVDGAAGLAAPGGRQQGDVDLSARRLNVGEVSVASLAVKALAADLRAVRGIDATISAHRIAQGDLWIDTFEAKAGSDAAKSGRLAYRINAVGRKAATPVAISASGDFESVADRQTLRIAHADGRYDGQVLKLEKPLLVKHDAKETVLSATRIAYGAAHLDAAGRISATKVSGDLTLAAMPLESLSESAPKGTLSARVKLDGSPPKPTVDLTARLALRDPSVPAMTVDAKVRAAGGKIDGSAAMTMEGGTATVEAAAPMRLSLVPFAFDLPRNGKLTGKGSIRLALEALNGFLRRSGNEAGGRIAGDFRLAGSVAAPSVEGRVNLVDGRYDQLRSGICLRRLNATIDGNGDRWRLSKLSARDEQGGSLSGSGGGGYTPSAPIDAKVGMKGLQLFCRGIATGKIGGNLTAKGVLADFLVAGKILLGPLSINLPGGAESDIPSVEVVRKGEKPRNPEGNAVSRNIRLDIGVDAPGRVFVRGRGLDAELGGKLRVQGTAAGPSVFGKLATRRGSFNLLGRPLKLTKVELQFAGSVPPSPFLDVAAESKVEDTTITVALGGPAQKPSLTLSSVPALPQDELLSRLLFGRNVQSITAFQAIQLAQSIAELSGKSSGPGLLDRARNTLGVDTLTVDQGVENETTVGAGKYISDNVFVGVQQGAAPEDRKVTTEIEVSPKVSVGTSTNSRGGTGANLQWKWDY